CGILRLRPPRAFIDVTLLESILMLTLIIDLVLRISFFSSRRRHTRSKRDWSSDVCSSDLFIRHVSRRSFRRQFKYKTYEFRIRRSEERRVGKECRSRWWGYGGKKKTK